MSLTTSRNYQESTELTSLSRGSYQTFDDKYIERNTDHKIINVTTPLIDRLREDSQINPEKIGKLCLKAAVVTLAIVVVVGGLAMFRSH